MTDWREMSESLQFIKEISDKCELLVKELCEEPSLVDPVNRAFHLGAHYIYTHSLDGFINRAASYASNAAGGVDSPAWGEHPVTSSIRAYLMQLDTDMRALQLMPNTTKHDAAMANNRTRGWLYATNHMWEIVGRLTNPEKTSAKVDSDAGLPDVAPRWEEFLD